jgi:hypothetical protein
MSVEILDLPQGGVEEACALFADVYGHPISPQAWRWKYADGPRLGQVNIVARATGGRLLGHIGASVFPGHWKGQSLPMVQVCDVMLRREARGGLARDGVYPRMMAALQQRLAARHPGAYAYGFPGERPFVLGERLGDYRRLYTCHEARPTAGALAGWRRWSWRARPVAWSDASWLDQDWQHLAARQPAPLLVRSAAYLAWRYRDHPSLGYRLWRMRHWGQPAGWMVSRKLHDGSECLVDALLPDAARAGAPACAALWRALHDPTGKGQGKADRMDPLATWLPLPGATPTQIVAIEIRVDGWHPEMPAPLFQPGDTDVY